MWQLLSMQTRQLQLLLLLTLIIAGCVDVDCVLNGLSHTHTHSSYTHIHTYIHTQGRTLEAA